jgi:MerR family redox-sensitive transcriptional activator SoxR
MDKPIGMSIGEVARRAGVRPSAIRYYESVGVLPQPERTAGQRRYDPSILTWLQLVASASEAGFTMAEIRKLVSGFDPRTPPALRWRELAVRKLEEVDALVARTERMRTVLRNALGCGCARLEDCGRLLGGPVRTEASQDLGQALAFKCG